MSWLKRIFSGRQSLPPMGEFETLMIEGRQRLEELTFMNQTNWRFGQHERWNLDSESGILRFEFADGEVVDCVARAVGSLDQTTGTWMWAWNNESLAQFPELLEFANRVKAFGEEHQYPALTTPAWPASVEMAWAMTGLTVKLCEGHGAYCAIRGPLQMFLAFKEVRLKRFSGIDEILQTPEE